MPGQSHRQRHWRCRGRVLGRGSGGAGAEAEATAGGISRGSGGGRGIGGGVFLSFYSGNSKNYLIMNVSITEKLDMQENVSLNNYKHISKTLG